MRNSFEQIIGWDANKTRIEAYRRMFDSFAKRYGNMLDLSKDDLSDVIEIAGKEGIFRAAKEARELVYGRGMSVYGVSYISNVCDEKCVFCPMGQKCIKTTRLTEAIKTAAPEEKVQLEALIEEENRSLRTLTLDEAQEDFNALVKLGHTEICLLTGSGLCLDYTKLIPYVRAALTTTGVREVILNVSQFTESVFRNFMIDLQAGFTIPAEVRLQYRLFQETFDREVYAKMMRYGDPVHGKGNFRTRYYSLFVANFVTIDFSRTRLRGVDRLGEGVLFGLSRYPIGELQWIRNREFWLDPYRICLPFANAPTGSDVEIPYMIPGRADANGIIELIYALARLAFPERSIVSSERDGEGLLVKLDDYANHTTLNVRPYPGGNIDALAEIEGRPLRFAGETPQAEVHPRDIKETIRRWKEAGREVINFEPHF